MRKTNLAQRKYAHKVIVPAQNDSEPPELEQTPPPPPPQPVLVKTHKTVDKLLDFISFENIHVHKRDMKQLKRARIILERIEPSVAQNAQEVVEPVENRLEEAPIIIDHNDSSKNKGVKRSKSTSDKKRRSFKKQTTDAAQHKPITIHPTSSKSKEIDKSAPYNLRNRSATGDWLTEHGAKQGLRASRRVVQRRSSNSTEDNRPLTYFAKSKNKLARQYNKKPDSQTPPPTPASKKNIISPKKKVTEGVSIKQKSSQAQPSKTSAKKKGSPSKDIKTRGNVLRIKSPAINATSNATSIGIPADVSIESPETSAFLFAMPAEPIMSTATRATSIAAAEPLESPVMNVTSNAIPASVSRVPHTVLSETNIASIYNRLPQRGEQIEQDLLLGNISKSTIEQNNVSTITHPVIARHSMLDNSQRSLKAAITIKGKMDRKHSPSLQDRTVIAEVTSIISKNNLELIKETSTEIPRPESANIETTIATYSSVNEAQDVNSELPLALLESRKFWATEEEFTESPIIFASKQQQKYKDISLCGIKPPRDFSPPCTKGGIEISFKVSNQYVHRMMMRWGTATKELTAIRSIQDPKIQRSPLFEGLEVDLVKLFNVVQSENGIEACTNNDEKWQNVAQKMKLYCRGKANTKLENIYLKYLLSYNSLTSDERENANIEVTKHWKIRENRSVHRSRNPLWRQERMRAGRPLDDNKVDSHLERVCAEAEECVTPGRHMNFTSFEKLAVQVKHTYFPEKLHPSVEDVERAYWSIVTMANAHVCVHAASVDAIEQNWGFPDEYELLTADTSWNLKRLGSSPENLLSYLGPTVGVSSAAIHFGMMFASSCWHMDPTGLPWIEYLHSGSSPKIWYSIPASQGKEFRAAAERHCAFAVQNKQIWLPSDIIMIDPILLRQVGILVERHVQQPGEYVVVYPNTFCACVDTGLTISEGVYYAPRQWLAGIDKTFRELSDSCEPSLFSKEKLLMAIAESPSAPYSLLKQVRPSLEVLLTCELNFRRKLTSRSIELISPQDYTRQVFLEQNQRASRTPWQLQSSGECAYCRCHIHLSRVVGLTEGQTAVCAKHGVHLATQVARRLEQLTNCYCITLVSCVELQKVLDDLDQRLKNQKSISE